MIFTDESAVLRQICNGIMCVGAIMVIDTFVRYLWQRSKKDPQWTHDIAVVAAISLIILLSGHAIRAFSGWMQFLALSLHGNASFWANSMSQFLLATLLIVIGKVAMIYFFSPERTRHFDAIVKLIGMSLIPVLIAVIAEMA
jgi:hypothetical protein